TECAAMKCAKFPSMSDDDGTPAPPQTREVLRYEPRVWNWPAPEMANHFFQAQVFRRLMSLLDPLARAYGNGHRGARRLMQVGRVNSISLPKMALNVRCAAAIFPESKYDRTRSWTSRKRRS